MKKTMELNKILDTGLSVDDAHSLYDALNKTVKHHTPSETWRIISQTLSTKKYPFSTHLLIFTDLFPTWPDQLDSAPAIQPDPKHRAKTNIGQWMAELGMQQYKTFHQWSYTAYQAFWGTILKKLHIHFYTQPSQICDLSGGVETPRWLVGAKLNIAENCFHAPDDKIALVYQDAHRHLKKMTYRALNELSSRVASHLQKSGFKPQDAIAIVMPMTVHAVAIYLGIIKMGGVVVSIADSFSSEEIAIRLNISKAKALFTQDVIIRDHKTIPLYEKIMAAHAPTAIVVPHDDERTFDLREHDIHWKIFLTNETDYTPYQADPMTPCTILFSSGTTGTPKAIPWDHTTPIKSASDAFLHQDVQPQDVICWPTSLGWMMGPWVIYSALINQATLALYHDTPTKCEFGQFIQDAHVTILGVVPALVSEWRKSHCMESLDWHRIRLFSSSGECSNPEDMLYLMHLAGYKPIIEYCGGTETGGSYITSTLIENNYPSVFTTATLGGHFVVIDEHGMPTDQGEVALVPPSLGLSTTLLNANHHDVYFANMPTLSDGTVLRRHGDQIIRFPSGLWSILGRVDDTMNLSGIKISSAEIERVISGIPHISETAAVAIAPKQHGPHQLVIYAVTSDAPAKEAVKKQMQSCINTHLNPLFKIHDVVFIPAMPKTASNKTMRRILRDQYAAGTR